VSKWQQDLGSAATADQVCHLQRRTTRLWQANPLDQQRPRTGRDPRRANASAEGDALLFLGGVDAGGAEFADFVVDQGAVGCLEAQAEGQAARTVGNPGASIGIEQLDIDQLLAATLAQGACDIQEPRTPGRYRSMGTCSRGSTCGCHAAR